MRQATHARPGSLHRANAFPTDAGRPMSKVVYRSRAAKTFSPHEMHELTCRSQARNAREAVTGVMVYDDHRFFQWIEGPADGVDRIMHSIRNDERHTDVDVLGSEQSFSRTFDGWSMKLATPGPVLASWRRDVIDPPREIMESLRKCPELASSLLMMLSPVGSIPSEQNDDFARISISDKTAAIIKAVFLSAVIPELRGANGNSTAPSVPLINPRTRELADLLVSSDQAAAMQLIEELSNDGLALKPMFATLFESAARRLGDLWGEDLCTEFDVTLGLCRLQTAASFLAPELHRPGRLTRPAVLIAPEPGELHRLGATLDGSVLRKAGWCPQSGNPSSDEALQELVSTQWFDVLDLSLSIAFRRDHLLGKVSKTIENVRHASCNQDLTVIVGGRVFLEEDTAAAEVGADFALTTASDVERSILRTVNSTRIAATSSTVGLQVVPTPSK